MTPQEKAVAQAQAKLQNKTTGRSSSRQTGNDFTKATLEGSQPINNSLESLEIQIAEKLTLGAERTVEKIDQTLEKVLDAIEPLKNGQLISALLEQKLVERGWNTQLEGREDSSFFLARLNGLIEGRIAGKAPKAIDYKLSLTSGSEASTAYSGNGSSGIDTVNVNSH